MISNKMKVTDKRIGKTTALVKEDLKVPVIKGWNNQKAQRELNTKFLKDILAFKREIEEAARKGKKEAEKMGYPFRQHVAMTVPEVIYQDDKLLVLSITYYQYTGGAHGFTEREAFNINLPTGKILSLSDIFQPGVNYKEIINEKIREQITAQPNIYFPLGSSGGFTTISDNQEFYLIDNNLVIYFPLYEIAPYASGIPEFRISLAELGDTIKEDFVR